MASDRVEIVAVIGLVIISLVALILGKSTDVPAAAVGGIAGYLTHKFVDAKGGTQGGTQGV